MKKQRKEFIKQAHSAACSEWKEKIETEFPKLFKKDELVVGKWYKYDDVANWKVFITSNVPHNARGYGFNTVCQWMEYCNAGNSCELVGLIPATDKEVSEALIAEASKRGFKKGVTIKSQWINGSDNTEKLTSDDVCINRNFQMSCWGKHGYYTIFKNGIWAEIIEEPVYEWQYSFSGHRVGGFKVEGVSSFYYTSKKEFIKRQSHLTPIKKVKESKRIRK
jgi:hypothetical protein